MPTEIQRYYPRLSTIVTTEEIPDVLGFVKDGVVWFLDQVHYKDLQYSKSPQGDAAFYSLSIVSKKRLSLEIPGTGIALVINKDWEDNNISAFPITLEYEWKVLAFLRGFNVSNFSFSPQEIYELALRALNLTEEQVMAHYINNYTPQPQDPNAPTLEQFVADVYGEENIDPSEWPVVNELTTLRDITQDLYQKTEKYSSILAFATYLWDNDINQSVENVKGFFKSFIPEDIDAYIKDILIPKFRATLLLTAGVEFPRSMLQPVYDEQGNDLYSPTTGTEENPVQPQSGPPLTVISPDDEGFPKVMLSFGEALFYADTQNGFGYNMDLVINTSSPAMIGDSGLIIDINNLKIDLSDKENILEADSDGRPPEFMGVYIERSDIYLPQKWFKKETGQTLAITGDHLIIGTGGVSGTIALRATYSTAIDEEGNEIVDSYYENYFEINYPIRIKIGENQFLPINSHGELVDYINTLSHPNQIKFDYPISVTETGGTSTRVFESELEYFNFLGSLQGLDDNRYMWFKLGKNEEKAWQLGFERFDVTFHHGEVVESNLHAQLVIPKLKNLNNGDDADDRAIVNLVGHWESNEDFRLSAQFLPTGLNFNLFGLINLGLQTAALGKEEDIFYLESDTKISFPEGTLASTLFGGQEIEIPALRYYFDGRFEIVGGTGFIPVNFTLPIGPIDMSVTGIHLGSEQIQHNGILRTYNYIGFDGGLSVSPIGLDVRGNGVKFYYTVDNDEIAPAGANPDNYGHSFFRISTIEVDLIIPGDASPSAAIAIIKGSLTIPEPGISTEYIGKISVQLPKAKIYGEANMRLDPKYPAYLIDASVEFPVPIPLGPIGIFGFRGLLGYRYVAEKEAIGMTYNDRWYDYYMAPQRGINVDKFSGPHQTENYQNAFSVGLGASIATMDSGGRLASLRAMMLLSIPSVFAIDAGLTILSERLGLAEDDPRNPPFYGFIMIGDDSLEVGAGADYSINRKGWILHIQARMEMGFFFRNQRPWYVNFGTRETPVSATLFKGILNINAYSFLMLSASGIEVGAGVRFDFDFKVAKAEVSIQVGGFISFRRPHAGGFIHVYGMVEFDFWIIAFSVELNFYFRVELTKPFLIMAEIQLKVCARIGFGWFSFRVCLDLKLKFKWEKNKEVDRKAIPAITADGYTRPVDDFEYGSEVQTENFVKGVHMVTFETFPLDFLGIRTTIPSPSSVGENYIPLDTYLDIKSEKGLIPSTNNSTNFARKIGGHTGGAKDYLDLIPPKRQVEGNAEVLRQVKHQYSIENIEIKAAKGSGWINYEPVKAVLPNDQRNNELYQERIGYWQKNNNNGRYDSIRVLATNPFSFLDGAEPGWFIPEQYGITPSTLYCSKVELHWHYSNVLNKNLGTIYYPSVQPNGANLINGAYYTLAGHYVQEVEIDPATGESTGIPLDVNMVVTNTNNPFGFDKSLEFNNSNQLLILIPEPSLKVNLKLTTTAQGVTIKYFRVVQSDNIFPVYEEIDTVYKSQSQLESEIIYDGEGNIFEKYVSKVEIIPDFPEIELILQIQEEIAEIWAIAEENAPEDAVAIILTTEEKNRLNELQAKLKQLREACADGNGTAECEKDELLCELYITLLGLYNSCYPNPFDIKKVCDHLSCFNNFMNTYLRFDRINPSYQLIKIHIGEAHLQFNSAIQILNDFCSGGEVSSSQVTTAYNQINIASQSILNTINDLGNCDCEDNVDRICKTSIQEVRWVTVEDWQYFQTIPSQEAVQADHEAMVEGLSKVGQAIWRPNTTYLLKFTLKDTVDNNEGGYSKSFDYYYGFKTAGPLGHFHKQIDYVAPNTSADEYPITSLSTYIDYKRSYPNADGNLLLAKPIFYGNDQCKIDIFFSKPHVFHMLNDWEDYESLGTIKGAMHLAIKDPVSGVIIPYPLPENWEGHETVPETTGNGENGISWIDDNDPRIPLNIQYINNFIQFWQHFGLPCEVKLGDPIQPAANAFSVTLANLKPNKLYTALVYNAFDENEDGQIANQMNGDEIKYEESQRIHDFVFKTSRYSNFKEQINSYILQELDDDGMVIDEKLAVYSIEIELEDEQVNNAWILTQGSTNNDLNNIASQYHHPFDRVISGILEIKPLDPPMTTEFIIVKRKSEPSTRIGILIRNPEPFNDPKISLNEIENTVRIAEDPDNKYKKIFAKDYSQIWMMNGKKIPDSNLKFEFQYLQWDGQTSTYRLIEEVATESIEINPQN